MMDVMISKCHRMVIIIGKSVILEFCTMQKVPRVCDISDAVIFMLTVHKIPHMHQLL